MTNVVLVRVQFVDVHTSHRTRVLKSTWFACALINICHMATMPRCHDAKMPRCHTFNMLTDCLSHRHNSIVCSNICSSRAYLCVCSWTTSTFDNVISTKFIAKWFCALFSRTYVLPSCKRCVDFLFVISSFPSFSHFRFGKWMRTRVHFASLYSYLFLSLRIMNEYRIRILICFISP